MDSDEFFKSEGKIYTKKSIGIATFFGGPIVTGYMISKNFVAFGEMGKSKTAFKNGVFGSVLFFTILLAIPEKYMNLLPSSLYSTLFPALYIAFGILWMDKIQGNLIKNHIDQGGGTYSAWQSSKVGLIGMLVTIAVIFSISMFSTFITPEMSGEKVDYIDNKNRVYFENVNRNEVDEIIYELISKNFFAQNYDFYFKIEGTENGYKFLFPATDEYWESPELLGYYTSHKSFLERKFPNKDIKFTLFQESFRGRQYKDISYNDTIPLWWMEQPSQLESEKDIAERLIAYLTFWECFFQYGIDRDLEEMSWPSIPNVIKFASNGIALTGYEKITDEWKNTYFDEKSAKRAYSMLRESFSGVRWEDNALIFKSYVKILSALRQNMINLQPKQNSHSDNAFDKFFSNSSSANTKFTSLKKEIVNDDISIEIFKEDEEHYEIGKKYRIKFKVSINNDKYSVSQGNIKLKKGNATTDLANSYFSFVNNSSFSLKGKSSSISTTVKNGVTKKSATFTYPILFNNAGDHKLSIKLNKKLNNKEISFNIKVEDSKSFTKFNSDIDKIIEYVKSAKITEEITQILSEPKEKTIGANKKTTILKYDFFGKILTLYVMNNQIIDYVISGEMYDYTDENIHVVARALIRP